MGAREGRCPHRAGLKTSLKERGDNVEALIGIVVLVVGLLISVALHELGHMIPAKRFGVRVSEYFVGFGPTLWSRQRGETEYGLKAVPLGGYVKLVGMIPPAEAVKPVKLRGWAGALIGDARDAAVAEVHEGEDHRAFYRLAWWKKVIVMAGGPVVNLVLAAVIFTVVFSGFGVPQPVPTVYDVAACVPATGAAECAATDPVSPALEAGLRPGDTVVAVDGQPVTRWTDLTSVVAASAGQSVVLTVEREGRELDLRLVPAPRERAVLDSAGAPVLDDAGQPVTETVGYLGVYPTSATVRQPWWTGLSVTGQQITAIAPIIVRLPVEVYHVGLAMLGIQERDNTGIMGVVGVGRAAGEIASADVEGYTLTDRVADMLLLLGSLNLALFMFNMIPLVPLDGGHIASALWQAIKNGWARVRGLATPRPVDVARMMPLAYGVFGLLIVMTVVLVVADIVAPVQLA